MAQIVEYILSLKDDLSKGLEGANIKAEALESTLKTVGEVVGVLGVSMVAFAGLEALKGAHEVWEKMEFSISQVEAGLKSTHGAAGLTFEEIQDSATKTAHDVKFAASEILGMQSVLLTFPSITKDSFQPATDIIADMATRLGQDLKSSAIEVGKALQDPIKGVTALRRVGVNFNETQTETIKNLAETNRLAEAQALIMNELNLEFGGSAAAAAAADAGFRYEKSLEEIRLEVGHLVDKLQEEFMPVALKFLEWVKASVDWIKQHTSMIKSLAVGLAAAAAAFYAMKFVPVLLLGIENALVAAATGGVAFGTAMTAALGPVGLITAAVGILAFTFTKLGDNIEEANIARNKFLATSNDKEVTYLEEISKGDNGKDAVQKEKESLQQDLKDLQGKMLAANTEDSNRINDQITETLGKINTVDRFQQGLIPKKGAPGKDGKPADEPAKTPATKATGSKSITINVSIKELIHEYTNKITNVQEMGPKIKEHVVGALTAAINDFQIVAGH